MVCSPPRDAPRESAVVYPIPKCFVLIVEVLFWDSILWSDEFRSPEPDEVWSTPSALSSMARSIHWSYKRTLRLAFSSKLCTSWMPLQTFFAIFHLLFLSRWPRMLDWIVVAALSNSSSSLSRDFGLLGLLGLLGLFGLFGLFGLRTSTTTSFSPDAGA